jgi:IS1 family transposase
MFTLEVDMNRLSIEKRTQILAALVEGNSLRAISRMTDVSLTTVLKFVRDLGAACAIYQNEKLRGLTCKRVQADEIWSFIGCKERNVPKDEKGRGRGDCYTWVAMDSDTKLVLTWCVGTRDAQFAKLFMDDLAPRLANRVQLTTDGHHAYLVAVENAFGGEIDYAKLVKLYGEPFGNRTERRYSPADVTGVIKETVSGNPEERHISTSHIERQNLTMRMGMRRFTRLTNGFSKKIENHEYALGIHYMHYNFARQHKSLRVTPAMAAGISQHIWALEEIVALAD